MPRHSNRMWGWGAESATGWRATLPAHTAVLWPSKCHPAERPLLSGVPPRPGLGAWAALLAKSLHSCPTLCDPMDYNLPGSSVRGIFQARTLEWVSTSYSRGSFQPRDQTCIFYASCTGQQILYYHPTWEALRKLSKEKKKKNKTNTLELVLKE